MSRGHAVKYKANIGVTYPTTGNLDDKLVSPCFGDGEFADLQGSVRGYQLESVGMGYGGHPELLAARHNTRDISKIGLIGMGGCDVRHSDV